MCEEGSEENRFGTAMAGQWGTWDGARTCLLGKEGGFGAGCGFVCHHGELYTSVGGRYQELNIRSSTLSCSIAPLPSGTRGRK